MDKLVRNVRNYFTNSLTCNVDMESCRPSTEEGRVSLARLSALVVIHEEQFVFIGMLGEAETVPTTSNSTTTDSLSHAALKAPWEQGQFFK